METWPVGSFFFSFLYEKLYVFVRNYIAVKRHHDNTNTYKGKPLIGLSYNSEF